MADTHTPSLRLRLLEVGANEDTWGDELNANVISMIEEAVAGIVSISVTAGNVTLSTANGTMDQARNALIKLTGTPAATRTVTFPDVEKLTWVINAVGDSSPITCTAGAGTSVSIPAGSCVLVYTDGATNAAAVPVAYLTNGKLGIGMTPSNVLDITQNQNGVSTAKLLNSDAGATAVARLLTANGTSQGELAQFGSGFTTSGVYRQNGTALTASGAGGLTIGTSANQPLYFIVNNTEVGAFNANGLGLHGQVPSTNTIFNIAKNQDARTTGTISNNDAGTAAFANWTINNGTSGCELRHNGAGFTTAGMQRQAGSSVHTNGPGGLSLFTTANQPVYFGVNSTQVAAFNTTPALDLTCGQIKFPASQVASADANTLDDYEEGTFTPTLNDGAGNNYTLATALGFYTKIGNRVHADMTIIWTAIGAVGATQLRVGALPFTASNTTNYRSGAALGDIAGFDTTATLNQIVGLVLANETAVRFERVNDNANPNGLPANSSSANGSVMLSITYMV